MSRRLTVTWHPDAVRRAISHAQAITSAGGADDDISIYEYPGGRLSFMDLAALVDASRAALVDNEAVDWQQVALKLALAEDADYRRLTTPEVEALRQLVDAEHARQTNATPAVPEGGDDR